MSTFNSLQDLTPKEIEVRFDPCEVNINGVELNITILRVKGNYPRGSSGSLVGEFLRGLGVFLREIFNLDALIIDLSKLNYEWGNNLLRVAKPEALQTSSYFQDTWLGYYIVGSKENKDALRGLFCEFGKSSGIKEIYLSVDEAIKDIVEKAKRVYKDEKLK